jgi:aminomethyltransferase
MDFMTSKVITPKLLGEPCRISRCGYTGEDGFEISITQKSVWPFIENLTSKKTKEGLQIAKFIGLGARDTLRIEAGLCLYGHELDEHITPVEAVLGWTISKRRKQEGGFLGDEVI